MGKFIMSKDYEKLENAISDLNVSSTKLSSHIEYIREDFADIKDELKSIAKILEIQIRHDEELKHIKIGLEKTESCYSKSAAKEERMKNVEDKIKLMNSRFSKIAFILFSGIVSIVVKLVLSV